MTRAPKRRSLTASPNAAGTGPSTIPSEDRFIPAPKAGVAHWQDPCATRKMEIWAYWTSTISSYVHSGSTSVSQGRRYSTNMVPCPRETAL